MSDHGAELSRRFVLIGSPGAWAQSPGAQAALHHSADFSFNLPQAAPFMTTPYTHQEPNVPFGLRCWCKCVHNQRTIPLARGLCADLAALYPSSVVLVNRLLPDSADALARWTTPGFTAGSSRRTHTHQGQPLARGLFPAGDPPVVGRRLSVKAPQLSAITMIEQPPALHRRCASSSSTLPAGRHIILS